MRSVAALACAALLWTGACARHVDLTTPTDTSEPRATANPSTPAPTTTPTNVPVPETNVKDIPFDQRNRPKWLDDKIQAHMNAKAENPRIRILSYQYQGQTVYYETSPCCDQFTTLYDAKGNVLCAPDGGITGRGDGKCPDFEKNRTAEQLVWQDAR
ncbi:DUF6970 domain-containing protein [Hymenobacter jeollabukensis]|uniref:DUF6970 domain-containing protein n=1 Tax=Hymenobacter jeollabukensis TaxID=2025313 RepID=A0A5R8WUP9_9BACT|nr:hypothetical protein [Hymenobacter jeollabukensis]TLM95135.1 hypothetical protein FDY95_04895 [Hymenobacter jeollabukensis]